MLMITVDPHHLSRAIIEAVDTALAVGIAPEEALAPFLRGKKIDPVRLRDGEALCWSNGLVEPVSLVPASAQHRRHRRKYAAGDLHDQAFVFRGPEGKLKLRAQNLAMFLQMAEGVDVATWEHHLRRGDYSRWFREAIKDDDLAAEAQRIERGGAPKSREAIRRAIETRYTLPK